MKIRDPKAYQDFLNGVIEGETIEKLTKVFKDAKHFYDNGECDLSDDALMYEVYIYANNDPKIIGNMSWGLTVMQPVLVNNECNVTRGHFHEDLNCSEIYVGFAGEGLLILMDENNECYAEKVSVGSIHYINGKLAHRLINTGDSEFKVGCCWNTTAGHDYERIENNPFTYRVFKNDGKIETRKH